MLASQMAGNSGVGVLALSKQEVLEYPEDGLSWTGALSWSNVVLPVTPPLTIQKVECGCEEDEKQKEKEKITAVIENIDFASLLKKCQHKIW